MTSFVPSEPYASRSIRFLRLWEERGWRMKVYGIAYRREKPAPRLVAAALRLTGNCLPDPAVTATRYGVGYVGVHQGRGSNLVFVDWWEDENELHHRVFTSTPDHPGVFQDRTATPLTACVWDLAVMGFERQAWVASALQAPGRPDLGRYVATRFQGEI